MFVGIKCSLERIVEKFAHLSSVPRKLVKIGFYLFLLIFAAGTLVVLGNRYFFPYNPYYDFISIQLVKNSFTVLAEFIVGAIVMDFVFSKNE